ncbi:MAG: creatininase family protein [Sandaracinaceae bacterium]|nr:creatininase family protein [Sandaracinaceae bacterium]
MGHLLHDLRWPDVLPLLEAGATAVLPVGSAAKEHGPHLPMRTDYLTAEALGRRLAKIADVLVWPAVGYGHYPAFRAYPGSTSVPEEAFESTIFALVEDLRRPCGSKVLVLNTGISTIRAIDSACSTFVGASGCHVYRGARYSSACAERLEQPRGGHGDEAETSVMLHLHPELVDMTKAPTWTREVRPGAWSPTDESSESYSPSGIYGDASLATAEKGAALVDAMLEDLVAALAG